MPKLREICSHVRSKNAGPFWVTVDLFFGDSLSYATYKDHPALSAEAIARALDVPAGKVKRFALDSLNVVKFSYPRASPQGGQLERDMHSGQQFVKLLDVSVI